MKITLLFGKPEREALEELASTVHLQPRFNANVKTVISSFDYTDAHMIAAYDLNQLVGVGVWCEAEKSGESEIACMIHPAYENRRIESNMRKLFHAN